ETLYEGAGVPVPLSPPPLKEKADRVWGKTLRPILFKLKEVPNPIPRQFEVIRSSHLPQLLGEDAKAPGGGERGAGGQFKPGERRKVDGGGAAPPAVAPPGEGDKPAEEKKPKGPDRSGWQPLGRLALESFTAGLGAGGGGGPGVVPGAA